MPQGQGTYGSQVGRPPEEDSSNYLENSPKFEMRGHIQPGPFQRKSPLKQNPKGLIFDPTQSGKKTYLSQDMYTGMEGTSQEWKDAHPISSKLYRGVDKASAIYWRYGGHGATKKDMSQPYIPRLAQHLVGGAVMGVGLGVNILEKIAGNVARHLKIKSTKTGEIIGSKEHRIKKGYITKEKESPLEQKPPKKSADEKVVAYKGKKKAGTPGGTI